MEKPDRGPPFRRAKIPTIIHSIVNADPTEAAIMPPKQVTPYLSPMLGWV